MKTITRNILLALTFVLTTNSQVMVAQTDTAEPKTKKTKADDSDKEEKAKPTKKPNFSRLSPDFVSVFKSVSKSMEASTVTVMSKGKQVTLGIIIDADGLILTKASELKRDLVCQIGDETFEAEVIGIHGKTDLALLKINADELNPIQWAKQTTHEVGNWVMSPKAQKGDCAIGVISTKTLRQIKRSRPFVGITMANKENGILIKSVVNRSPADLSGLLVGDVIFKVDNQPVKEIKDLQNILGQFDAGDRVTLDVIRYKEEIQIGVTLAEFEKLAPSSQRRNQQNSMGSELSRRRKDFPLALQHDSMLQSNTCGGPLLDLSGNAIGINIARAGRVASYALPVETLLPVIELLKTGDLAPAIVNKEKIAALDAELEQLGLDLEALPEKRAVLNIQVSSQMAVRDELRKTIADLKAMLDETEKRLGETEENLDEFRTKMNIVRKKLRTGKKTTIRLKEQREELKTGSR